MRLPLLFIFLFASLFIQAQRYSRVKINLDESHTIVNLAEMGLAVDHGHYQPGKYFIGEFSGFELSQIQSSGFATQVLVEDLQAHLLAQNQAGVVAERVLPPCEDEHTNRVYQTPANYAYGSMAGYYTYQEMLDLLDTMAAKYPQVFKKKAPISPTLTTHEGRPVFYVKISDNPETDETGEPEVLYTAVHHAREPNSLSQMVFFLWYLLEHYETDEEIRYLVNETEMYFIPCVNPDGYIYNETTNPDGGGFWRKNRRDNLNGSFGVDLNRNYGFEWGHDDSGSSPSTSSETYRGPSASSEPETQMVQEFCLSRQFKIALNYHTFSNLLIWPWGYANAITEDHDVFSRFGDLMTQDNNYRKGLATQTVGYNVNGTSDDWMYGATGIYSMTPEVGPGTYGFWPPQSAIDGLNKDAMLMNIATARLASNYGILTSSSSPFIAQHNGQIGFDLEKTGLGEGLLTVRLEPLSNNIASVGPAQIYNLLHLEKAANAIEFALSPAIQSGDTVSFDLVLDNGFYAWRQPARLIFTTQAQNDVFDPGNDLALWQSFGDWAPTTESFYSAPSSITDSPGGNYLPNNFSEIILKDPVTVKDATAAFFSFWAKWDIEEDEDYAQVLVSVNGSSYFPLCGKYTEPGTPQQMPQEPVYDGTQPEWVKEEIDLSEYLLIDDSLELQFSFRLLSDQGIQADGFYFDDFTITEIKEEGVTSSIALDPSKFEFKSHPNPAGDFIVIDVEGEVGNPDGLVYSIFNTLGQEMKVAPYQGKSTRVDTKGLEPGLYYYRLSQDGKLFPARRFVVSK